MFVIHLILIFLACTMPFYLSWKIIILLLIINYIQLSLFKGCVLTNLQFNDKINKPTDMTMYSHSLELIGFKVNRKKIKFMSRYIFPFIIIILSLIWQILLNNEVLVG